jgi:hypothetical protein
MADGRLMVVRQNVDRCLHGLDHGVTSRALARSVPVRVCRGDREGQARYKAERSVCGTRTT